MVASSNLLDLSNDKNIEIQTYMKVSDAQFQFTNMKIAFG